MTANSLKLHHRRVDTRASPVGLFNVSVKRRESNKIDRRTAFHSWSIIDISIATIAYRASEITLSGCRYSVRIAPSSIDPDTGFIPSIVWRHTVTWLCKKEGSQCSIFHTHFCRLTSVSLASLLYLSSRYDICECISRDISEREANFGKAMRVINIFREFLIEAINWIDKIYREFRPFLGATSLLNNL